jgi:hypothetical protein
MPPAEYRCVRNFCRSKNAHAQLYYDFSKIMIQCSYELTNKALGALLQKGE